MATDSVLEAQIFKNRDDVQAWQVYADHLQSKGDLRGELIALSLKDPAAAETRIEAVKAQLLGEELAGLSEQVYDLEWKNGHLDKACLKGTYDGDASLDDLTKKLLARPCARFIRTLQFGLASYESDNDWSETFAAVAASPQATTLENLLFNDYESEDCEISWTAFGDFSPFWKKVPNLRTLHIRAGEGGELGDVVLPELRSFIRESGGLASAEIERISNATWPKLESLEIWIGQDNYGGDSTPETFATILAGKGLATLKHLGLVNGEYPNDLIEPIAKSPLLKQLKSLDLSKSTFNDEGIDALVKHAAAFKHLARLDLSENFLSDAAIARAKQVLPNVVADGQRGPPDDEYRYSVLGE
ncbi:MAG: molybdenum metabolism regulator [Myxococcaceae bacterium]|nr:molybdenum metabolism regulator [Myxococcaceae bacterium]